MGLSILKRLWWVWVILFIGLLIFAFAAYSGYRHDQELAKTQKDEKYKGQKIENQFGWPSPDAKYITNVPINLAQIQSISKYRSCAGHDRAGYNFNRVLETDRSMKHYFYPIPQFQGTIDKIELFAPFNGTVFAIQIVNDENPNVTYVTYRRLQPDGSFSEDDFTRTAEPRLKMGNDMDISTPMDENVVFGFRHVQFIRDFKPGDKVVAGELIGYASVAQIQNDFDIDLTSKYNYQEYTENRTEVLGSIFDHMTDYVLSEFAKYGITPENMGFSKEYRDANPCGYGSDKYGSTVCKENPEEKDGNGRNNDCWVQLQR